MHYVISAHRAPSAGDLRTLGPGDVVTVRRSATLRHDWAPIAGAAMAAFARGATVNLVDDTETKESN